jgi:hypothetical protein
VIAALLAIDRFGVPVVERWARGARGEEEIGRLLEALGDGWFSLHDINTGRGNIDHVVVGPAGLFTIETKSHRGRICVDRIEPRMLKQAYAQRKWLERVSGHEVEACLVDCSSATSHAGSTCSSRRKSRGSTPAWSRRRPVSDSAVRSRSAQVGGRCCLEAVQLIRGRAPVRFGRLSEGPRTWSIASSSGSIVCSCSGFVSNAFTPQPAPHLAAHRAPAAPNIGLVDGGSQRALMVHPTGDAGRR